MDSQNQNGNELNDDASVDVDANAGGSGNEPLSLIVIPAATEEEQEREQELEHEQERELELEGEGDYLVNGDASDMKKVKVYELVGSRWVDRGTAFCFGHLSSDGSDALLTARSEKNIDEVILSTTIRATDVYQRQQETLIVWTEPDGVDYALSFQDAEGCAEVWSFIVDVQRHLNGGEQHQQAQGQQPESIALSESSSSSSPVLGADAATATIMRTGHLPTPHLGGVLDDIDKAIKILARTQPIKEKICEYILNEEYIRQLVDVLQQAEEKESLENLHRLCGLMQTILMLNDHGIYEQILQDEYFVHVCGMLEYDPDFPTHKANYRQLLGTRFHSPIPIRDPSILRKIHHTYRLQFLKDVVLARVLDDSTFNVINGCIIFNQIDIIQHVQQDTAFLKEVVKLFVDEARPATSTATMGTGDHRRAVIMLIQNLCVMGKNVQLPARLALFRTLVDRGVLFAVQWGLTQPESESESSSSPSLEILSSLLDHDLNGVRGHILKQVVAIEKERAVGNNGAEEAQTLLEVCVGVLTRPGAGTAIQSQVGDALKVWLDVPLGSLALGMPSLPADDSTANGKHPSTRKDDPGTERFLDYFYKLCIRALFKPFWELPNWRDSATRLRLSRPQSNLYTHLCDLLYNFSLQHQFRSHFYLLSSGVLGQVATLMQAREKCLRHAAFRIFRLLLKLGNTNMMGHLNKIDAWKPILDLTIQESGVDKDKAGGASARRRDPWRDNLISCGCAEFWEYMRRENLKDPINFIMTKHESEIRLLAEAEGAGPGVAQHMGIGMGTGRFQLFIQRWEMNNEPMPENEEEDLEDSQKTHRGHTHGWPSREEEDYFNADDDDEDDQDDIDISIDYKFNDEFVPSISQSHTHAWSRGSGTGSPIPGANSLNGGLKRKRGRRMAVAGALAPGPGIGAGGGMGMGTGTGRHQRQHSQSHLHSSSLLPLPHVHVQQRQRPDQTQRPSIRQRQEQQQRQNQSQTRSSHLGTGGIGSLVDYGDEEDGEEISMDITESRSQSSSSSDSSNSSGASAAPPPSSPKPSHRQVSSTTKTSAPPGLTMVPEHPLEGGGAEGEDEDEQLEAAFSRSRPQSPAPGMMASLDALGPMHPSEKRRRSEEEEEEDGGMLERLAKKARAKAGGISLSLNSKNKNGISIGNVNGKGTRNGKTTTTTTVAATAPAGDLDPPKPQPAKKFKMKIGVAKVGVGSGSVLGSPSPSPSPSPSVVGFPSSPGSPSLSITTSTSSASDPETTSKSAPDPDPGPGADPSTLTPTSSTSSISALAPAAVSAAIGTPVPSEPGAKDGDTG